MKKFFLIIALFVGVAAPLLVSAQGFVPLAPIPGLTDIQPSAGGLAEFFNNLYKYLIGFAAILAVIMIIWGGLEYSTQDSISKKSDGKERILNAVLGLILVLAPVLVFSIINPSILNLSFNLPALETKSGPPAPATPARTLPTCSSIIRTNCVSRADRVNAVAEGLYASPQNGGQCYQISNCKNSSCKSACGESGCNYYCGNEEQCKKAFDQDPNKATGSSCTLYAK